jgi:formylglycine-generating enzyme required for sulfatase activity
MIQRILLVFLLTLSFFELSAQEKRVHTLEFVPYFLDTTPDCVEHYRYNQRFLVDSFPINKEIFKGFIQVHPLYRQQFNEISSQNESIRISSLGYHFKDQGLKEEDAVQWLQIDRHMKDSIMKTDYSYLLNHIIYVDEAAIIDSVGKIIHPDSIPNGIIYSGVFIRSMFIPKPFGYKEKLNFSVDTLPSEYSHLLEPFYLSQTEVSNFEYRKFINYVKDSIMKHLCYEYLVPEEAVKLLDCTKKELKNIDPKNKAENLKKYGFKEYIDFNSDSSIIAATKEMYYPQPERFYKRREIDVRKLNYKKLNGESINIYPDTLKSDAYLSSMYNWHPAYFFNPVLGLTKKQMEVYCEWKQKQVNKELKAEGKKYQVEVRLPYSYEYEFALQEVSTQKWNYVQDWPNNYYLTYQRNEYESFLNSVKSNETSVEFNTPIFHYNEKKHDLPYLFHLTDNASEMISDTLTTQFLTYYGLNSTESCENLCVAYGENYLTGVKSNSDFEYNELFYKTLLRIDQAHPAVGFRLVYKVIKNE